MEDLMDRTDMRSPSAGANQHGVRDHNERLILSLIQRQGSLPGSDLARLAGLSPQTVSVILRSLEHDGFVERGDPQRGRVGKPSVPMRLAADGVFSVGLKIGRRSSDLVLVDFLGTPIGQLRKTYGYPTPELILGFLKSGLAVLMSGLSTSEQQRVAGIGVAMPWQIWNWHEVFGAPEAELMLWRDHDIAKEIATFTDLPVYLENDATAACRAEHVFGRGREFRDFAYFYVGSFIGGGLVLNHSVYEGRFGNAGAFGPLPAFGPDGKPCQLLDIASIYRLEAALRRAGFDPAQLWGQPQDWSGFGDILEDWIDLSATEMARAALTVAAVIDMEAVLVDGAFPPDVKRRLVTRMRAAMAKSDSRGIAVPELGEGQVGGNARALGAACGPVFSRYLLNTHTAL
jgi:predicted NBD/HSP70 family sugar kinase